MDIRLYKSPGSSQLHLGFIATHVMTTRVIPLKICSLVVLLMLYGLLIVYNVHVVHVPKIMNKKQEKICCVVLCCVKRLYPMARLVISYYSVFMPTYNLFRVITYL